MSTEMKYAWIKLIISRVTRSDIGTKFIKAINQTPVWIRICMGKVCS